MGDDTVLKDMVRLSNAIRSTTGLHFPEERWKDMRQRVIKACRQLGLKEIDELIPRIVSPSIHDDSLKTLIHHLTIGETYFFRDQGVFSALRNHILPSLVESREAEAKSLSFVSLACCTGEEPYSIAMTLDQVLPKRDGWQVTILAGDINERYLEKAQQGIYTKWSLRQMNPHTEKRYFTRTGKNSFALADRIRQMVTFQLVNFAAERELSNFLPPESADLVFCRNVFMYLAPDIKNKVMRKVVASLRGAGWLVLSPEEAPALDHSGLEPVFFPNAILYRKNTATEDREPDQPVATNRVIAIRSRAPKTPGPLLKEHPHRDYSRRLDKRRSGPARRSSSPKSPLHKNKGPSLALYNEALSLFYEGSLDAAEEKMKGLWAILPEQGNSTKFHADAKALMARICAGQARLDEARKWAFEAAMMDKFNPLHHYLAGVILDEQDRPGEAARYFRQAIYLDPHFAIAHFNLGKLAMAEGRKTESRNHLQHVLDILETLPEDFILACGEGMTAKMLKTIVFSIMNAEEQAYGG